MPHAAMPLMATVANAHRQERCAVVVAKKRDRSNPNPSQAMTIGKTMMRTRFWKPTNRKQPTAAGKISAR